MSSQTNQVLVINLTTVQQHVDIVGSDGTKTSVNIMPKKRVYLEEGFKVCSNWIGHNPKTLKLHEPQTESESTEVAVSETNDKE